MRRVPAAAVLGVAAGLLLGACATTPPRAQNLEPELDFLGVARAEWRDADLAEASVTLASRLVALGEDENVVVSPLSLQLALALLREGASGVVAEEIDAAAGLSGDSQAVADLRAVLAVHEGDVAGIDPDDPPDTPLLHIADAVFVQPDYPVAARFLERVAAYHDAPVFEADFVRGQAKPLLDAWVREETGGLLEESPAELRPTTRVVLPDAVAVSAGDWAAAHAALAAGEVADVALAVPSWEVDTTLDLTDDLPALGLGSLLDPRGGLDGVFPDAVVSAVAQGRRSPWPSRGRSRRRSPRSCSTRPPRSCRSSSCASTARSSTRWSTRPPAWSCSPVASPTRRSSDDSGDVWWGCARSTSQTSGEPERPGRVAQSGTSTVRLRSQGSAQPSSRNSRSSTRAVNPQTRW